MRDQKIAILGGGLSGLSVAFWLVHEGRVPGDQIILYEKGEQFGGHIKTLRSPTGQMYEQGPRTIRLAGEKGASIWDMVRACGLVPSVIRADPDALARKFVVIDGRPQEIPSSTLSSLLSTHIGRSLLLSFLKEPFRSFFRKRKESNESLAALVGRIFPGDQLLQKLVDAYTSGIWAADASRLSAQIVAPFLDRIEASCRSVVVEAVWELMRSTEQQKTEIISFQNGLGQWVERLVSRLQEMGVILRPGTEVRRVTYEKGAWHVSDPDGTTARAAWLVCACDPRALPEGIVMSSLQDPDGRVCDINDFKKNLRSSVAAISCGWREDISSLIGKKTPPSFGMLAPASEDERVLGIAIDSSIFPQHSTTMATRITVMVGGTRYPAVEKMGRDELFEVAERRLFDWMGILAKPSERYLFLARSALALPEVGVERLPAYLIGRHLAYASSAIGGVAMTDCVHAARLLANRIGSECSIRLA